VKKIGLLSQIFIAFVLAVILGLIFGPSVSVIEPLGELFLRLLQFIVVPLIFATLITAVSGTDIKTVGRIGTKTVSFYLVTTAIAIVIGLAVGFLMQPGVGVDMPSDMVGETPDEESQSVVDTFLNIVPENPIEALAEGEILQIIFFALFIGIGVGLVGEKAKIINNFFDGFADVMYKITGMIIKVAPIGILGLIAPVVGEYGLDIILPLLKLIIATVIASIIHAGVTYVTALRVFGKMGPITFFKGIAPAALFAFSSASSAATLPITIENTQKNLGVSEKVSSFVLPLGATINMDGTAIYQGVAALFVAQLYGISLGATEILSIVLIATLASIGTAGVPGAGLVMLTLILSSIGLPLEGLALVAGIDRILDMIRCVDNIVGDATVAVAIDGTEKRKSKKKENIAAEQA